MFAIDVSISTSTPEWNLVNDKEFTVTLELLLPSQANTPITFRNTNTSLFDPTRRENDQYGIFYKDIAQDAILPLGRVQVCSFGAQGTSRRSLPLQKDVNEDDFTTLYPGKPHAIAIVRQPQNFDESTEEISPGGGRFQPKREVVKRERELKAETWRWPFTHGFRDGATYECGISDQAVISEWWKGSKEELVAARCAGSWPDDENQVVPVQQEVIRFNVVKTAQFLVRRNDGGDFGLSWP